MATLSASEDAESTSESPPLSGRTSFTQMRLSSPLVADGLPVITLPKAHLTFFNGLALVVSLQIGSGIFSAPSQVSTFIPSPALAVSAWILGGSLVYTGAMAFAELGMKIPHNGGIQEYLRHAYGDFVGCVFSWTWLVIAKPCSMAIISMVFSDYLCRSLLSVAWRSVLMEKMIAILGLVLITSINCFGVRSGALAANVFLCLKLFTLFSIAFAGLAFSFSHGSADGATESDGVNEDNVIEITQPAWAFFGNCITAFFGVLYCYGGWESIGFVAGEMRNPLQDLPRVLNTALACVTFGFTVFNIALYSVVPIQTVQQTNTPVVEFATRLWGDVGGFLYSIMVAVSAIGALNANVYATGRVLVSAANQGYFPAFLSEQKHAESPNWKTVERTEILTFLPTSLRNRVVTILHVLSTTGGHKALRRAIIANTCMTSIYIIGGTFGDLVTFVGISEYIFLSLAVAGIYVLRRNSSHPITYLTPPLYIAAFCTTSIVLVLRGVINSPMQGVGVALLVGPGWLIYRYIST